jgi:glycogen operon protein
MLLAGDEVAKTQRGNNNVYCQDNELAWFDWSLTEANAELLDFVRNVIAFRRAHPVLRGGHHPDSLDPAGGGHPEISWHELRAWQPDWSPSSRLLAMMWCGQHAEGRGPDYVYVAANAHWDDHELELPVVDDGWAWHLFADTAGEEPGAFVPGAEVPLRDPRSYSIKPRSVVALVARPVSGTR